MATTKLTKANARQIDLAIAKLTALSEHDWHVVSSLWSRGSDWTLEKRGSRWFVAECFCVPSGFATKSGCCEAIDHVICTAARVRRGLQDAA